MLITQCLNDVLAERLREADEIWCAMALINEVGYNFVQDNTKAACVQHWLVGVDLPTAASVLRSLQQRRVAKLFEAVLCKAPGTFHFHPKVFLFRMEKAFHAILGSSNLTGGGLFNNIELNYCITEPEDCARLLAWFTHHERDGYPMDDKNIKACIAHHKVQSELEEQIKGRGHVLRLVKPNITVPLLDAIDFSDRYFTKDHHWSFRKANWLTDTTEAVRERDAVSERMRELHEVIYPHFGNYGLSELWPNPMDNHLVSMTHQRNPDKPRVIDAMWLSYGKHPDIISQYQENEKDSDKDAQTFIHHARLQIRIQLNKIGLWLLFAKENGSLYDRSFFHSEMEKPDYRVRFFELVKDLPDGYYIMVSGKKEYCNRVKSPDDLYRHCRRDKTGQYFFIGKDYDIYDPAMSVQNLPFETLREFKRMLPLYSYMKESKYHERDK